MLCVGWESQPGARFRILSSPDRRRWRTVRRYWLRPITDTVNRLGGWELIDSGRGIAHHVEVTSFGLTCDCASGSFNGRMPGKCKHTAALALLGIFKGVG